MFRMKQQENVMYPKLLKIIFSKIFDTLHAISHMWILDGSVKYVCPYDENIGKGQKN